MSSDIGEDAVLQQNDSEDELDWEEVEVPEVQQHLEITLDVAKSKKEENENRKKGISHAERLIRIDCHKMHTLVLIANARSRNKWLNDEILQARLLSFVPLHLQTAFSAIHKSRVPDQNQRGRMFERAMVNLVNWWMNDFFEVLPEGHIKNRTFEEVQRGLETYGLNLKRVDNPEDVSLETDLEVLQDVVDDEVEPIRSAKSLMKHALMQRGSRDVSAQLFTTLCRGLGIPARLVVSIQSVPWQAGIGKPKPKYKKAKSKAIVTSGDAAPDQSNNANSTLNSDAGEGHQVDGESSLPIGMSEKAKGKQTAKPAIRLRKTKGKARTSQEALTRLVSPDPLTTPPVFWTEVFSKPDSKWFPIDPIRGTVNKRKVFDPAPLPSSNPAASAALNRVKVENRMLYVLAFEEDGHARDVTRRYARQYGAKIAKMQGGSNAPNVGGGGKGRQAWWDKVINALHRPYRLHRDDLEDQELDAAQLKEGMPTTIAGFKEHPLYVLERHLKQTETIYPPPPATPELGKFRGESVYPRSAVVPLKTAENWMRSAGRTVKVGQQPMKMVKIRAGTLNKIRELEVIRDELKVAGQSGEGSTSTEEIMQGLYAYSQTESYLPDPVFDGVIPKNNFGNIDLYVPSMLPEGAAHVPFKGVAKIAKKLGFDYAEAVTGFEFKKRRAYPVLDGVVVAAENEAVLLEAYWEATRDAEEKARTKKEQRVLKQWMRLIQGLRIRQSLQEKYGTKLNDKRQDLQRDDGMEEDESGEHMQEVAGGFVVGEGADRVVSAFHLPKNFHPLLPSSSAPTTPVREAMDEGDRDDDLRQEPELVTYDIEDADENPDHEMVDDENSNNFVPKTMQQLAEDASRTNDQDTPATDEVEILPNLTVPLTPSVATPEPINAKQTRSRAKGSSTTVKSTASSKENTPRRRTIQAKKGRGKRPSKPKDGSDSADDAAASSDGEEHVSPRKRRKVGSKKASTVTPTPTRTLRPRGSKSAFQIQRERDAEDAYRQAVQS